MFLFGQAGPFATVALCAGFECLPMYLPWGAGYLKLCSAYFYLKTKLACRLVFEFLLFHLIDRIVYHSFIDLPFTNFGKRHL